MREELEKTSKGWLQYWPVILSLTTIIIFSYKQTAALATTIETLNRLKAEHDGYVMPTLQKYDVRLSVIDEKVSEVLRRMDEIKSQRRN